jgi:hypothetical protein
MRCKPVPLIAVVLAFLLAGSARGQVSDDAGGKLGFQIDLERRVELSPPPPPAISIEDLVKRQKRVKQKLDELKASRSKPWLL